MRGGVANLTIRGFTLFFRFALSFYIVSYLGLQAAGIYGLAIAAIGIVPAAVGWGLNYFLSREVVGMTPDEAAPMVRDRLFVTFGSLAAGTVIALGVMATQQDGFNGIYLLILALLWLETFALDIYMPLIGLELALQANVLVLVRSALWIPFVIGLGIMSPVFRTMETIFIAWIISHFCAIALLVVFLRKWPVRIGLRSRPREHAWLVSRFRNGWYIYISDLGLVGIGYADRFILNAILGLTATGVYSFYWSITNALQTLIATIVQLALPSMIRAFRSGTPDDWRRKLTQEIRKTLAYASILSLMIFIATEAIIRLSPAGRFPAYHTLLIVMLLAAVIRSCSDLLNIAITSMGGDRVYAITNVLGVTLTVVLGASFMWLFGLIGAAIASLTTATCLFIVRFVYLRRRINSGVPVTPT